MASGIKSADWLRLKDLLFSVYGVCSTLTTVARIEICTCLKLEIITVGQRDTVILLLAVFTTCLLAKSFSTLHIFRILLQCIYLSIFHSSYQLSRGTCTQVYLSASAITFHRTPCATIPASLNLFIPSTLMTRQEFIFTYLFCADIFSRCCLIDSRIQTPLWLSHRATLRTPKSFNHRSSPIYHNYLSYQAYILPSQSLPGSQTLIHRQEKFQSGNWRQN